MTSKLKGGKTPPRLLDDLLFYNPQRLPPSLFNVLTDFGPQYVDGNSHPKKVAKGACRHRWALKQKQSTSFGIDSRPDSASEYKVAALCTNCMCHVDIIIDFRAGDQRSLPCPKEDAPLHHFLYEPNEFCGLVKASDGEIAGSWGDSQFFRCSNLLCSAHLTIRMRSPTLRPDWIALLVDRSLIKARAEKAMSDEPERFEGHAVPSPIEVMSNLRSYIHNAMASTEPRRIIANNKKWLLCLGDTCGSLLQYLGFARTENEWTPPRPDVSNAVPYTNPLNILLDDVEEEISVLLQQQPDEEKRISKIHFQSTPAMPEFERILGSRGYKKSPASRTVDLTQDEEHPFYTGLGTKMDFHDDLVTFAYERQITCDEHNSPYYLECLQGIARGRDSEELQTKVAIEASSGKISVRDIRDAYKSFGLEYPIIGHDDETIIGTFQSRVADAPRQESDLRRSLAIIGQARGSTSILHIASNTVASYEQALSWLGATEDMDDSFLVNMFGVKVYENPANESLARQCMTLIAETQNSSALKTWLATGELGEVEMDFSQAYMRLGIEDRTVDDELILSSFNSLVLDAPSQIKDLRLALTAIAKSRKSFYLQSFLDSGSGEHKPSEWPVGLENIGNTCYLNSLLQFYFTVKPLRNLVLNFDMYKMQLDDGTSTKKQVGSREVSRKEIERAQRFVVELRKLFHSMITISDNKVTPEQELARLTLISSSTEETIRRMSILSAQRPSLGDINGVPVHGPLLPATGMVKNSDTMMADANDIETGTPALNNKTSLPHDEVSSEGTLVEAPMLDATVDNDFMIIDSVENPQRQEQILEDKENLAPTKADIARPTTPENILIPLAESLPSRTNEQARPQSPSKDSPQNQVHGEVLNHDASPMPRPPNRPPPVPPRQKPEEHKATLQEEVEIGAQQDVTEVIANVLFQLQCAIKAESVDESGEQIDQIKELFFAKQKSYTTNQRGEIRSKEEFVSDIKVDVASGPRDIYAALDGAFDVQEVEVGGSLEPQYATISKLPPVLQILVQRAQFDPEKRITFKSINHLDLKETIYMDRYMDSADPDLGQRREACWAWKKELGNLQARRSKLTKTEMNIDMPEVLRSAAEYLKQCSCDGIGDPVEVAPELLKCLEKASNDVMDEISKLDDRIKLLEANINSQFADLRELPYRLHSVFIHRGLVNAGHYWIYIYDFASSLWRKYNDGYVTEVTDTNIIYEAEQSTRPATPYFLVYVKDDKKSELVGSVCRNVAERLQSSQEDTVMADDDRGTADLYKWSQQVSPAESVPQVDDEWGLGGRGLQPGYW